MQGNVQDAAPCGEGTQAGADPGYWSVGGGGQDCTCTCRPTAEVGFDTGRRGPGLLVGGVVSQTIGYPSPSFFFPFPVSLCFQTGKVNKVQEVTSR